MYHLSDQQSGALRKMETFAGVRSHRESFADREAFDEYWQRLSDRCDKKRSQGERGLSPAETAKRRQKRLAKYYSDEEHLLAYGIKYIQRYQPSSGKVRQQLTSKCQDAQVVEAVMSRLVDYLHDDQRAVNIADSLQQQGRNRQYITAKLRQRRFSPESIKRALTIITEETGSAWDIEALHRKVAQLHRQGKSRQAITFQLIEHQSDRPLVEAAVAEVFDEAGDDAGLKKVLEPLLAKGVDQRKIYQRLMSKGFRYPDIKRLMDE